MFLCSDFQVLCGSFYIVPALCFVAVFSVLLFSFTKTQLIQLLILISLCLWLSLLYRHMSNFLLLHFDDLTKMRMHETCALRGARRPLHADWKSMRTHGILSLHLPILFSPFAFIFPLAWSDVWIFLLLYFFSVLLFFHKPQWIPLLLTFLFIKFQQFVQYLIIRAYDFFLYFSTFSFSGYWYGHMEVCLVRSEDWTRQSLRASSILSYYIFKSSSSELSALITFVSIHCLVYRKWWGGSLRLTRHKPVENPSGLVFPMLESVPRRNPLIIFSLCRDCLFLPLFFTYFVIATVLYIQLLAVLSWSCVLLHFPPL